jgi:hypothetical protein
MDWYRQLFACRFLRMVPASMAFSSSLVSRSTKSPRLLSLSGEAACAFVLSSNTHLESREIPTSRRLTREGVPLIVGRQGNLPPDHGSMKYQ